MSAKRLVSIRRSLLTNLVAVMLLLGAAIVTVSYLGGRRAVRRFSESLIDQTLHRVEIELQAFFDPVHRELGTLRARGESGMLDTDDPATLNQLLEPMMRQCAWISSAMIAASKNSDSPITG